MPYTLHLHLLQCLNVQEVGGDEIYIKVNDKVIFNWKTINKRFSNIPNFPRQTDRFDFRTASYRAKTGWETVPDYTPEMFVFSGLEEDATIEVWESDEGELLRGDDDYLGVVRVGVAMANSGEKNALFKENGAEYALSYRISADS